MSADQTPDRPRCACGKAIYRSPADARTGMRGLQMRQPKARLHVYLCEESRAYHIGHAPGRRRA